MGVVGESLSSKPESASLNGQNGSKLMLSPGGIEFLSTFQNLWVPYHARWDQTLSLTIPHNCEVVILVPVRNEASHGFHGKPRLWRALELLAAQVSMIQQRSTNSFCCVAVDNGSTDQTLELLKQATVTWPHLNLRIIQEPSPGRLVALRSGFDALLNAIAVDYKRGRRTASPPLVAMTDSDIEDIDSGWLAEVATLRDGSELIFGGPTSFPKRVRSKYPKEMFLLDMYRAVTEVSFSWFGVQTYGPNMGIDPTLFMRLGGLLEPYGIPEAHDVYLGNRAADRGFLPKAIKSSVTIDPRRFLDNPYAFLTGHSYDSSLSEIRTVAESPPLTEEQIAEAWAERLWQLGRVHFALQTVLKPSITFGSRGVDIVSKVIGVSNAKEYRRAILEFIGVNPIEAADLLMHRYGTRIVASLVRLAHVPPSWSELKKDPRFSKELDRLARRDKQP